MTTSWLPFRALPAYLGGKRKLCRAIFALLKEAIPTEQWPELTFVDPFIGGGSVSLYAKARGFTVECNDIALRSAAIGRALIENGRVKLTEADLAKLLAKPDDRYPTTTSERYSPSVFPNPHAKLLDRALHNLNEFTEPTRSLAILLIVKWALRVQPMSMLRGTDARAAHAGDLDNVSTRRLGHYMKAKRLLAASSWRRLMDDVNSGVFPGRGRAHQQDALEFLAVVKGDVVYFDPPYAGTTSYEREYAVLDDLLEGRKREPSRYSRSKDVLPELFAAAAHIPIWLISLNNAAIKIEDLSAMVRRYRKNVRALEIPYRHLASIASKEKNAENKEYIILATN